MTAAELEELERLDAAATGGPWFVCQMDDARGSSALGISTRPLRPGEGGSGDWPGLGALMIAVTFMQTPPYVIDAHQADEQVDANAALIAAMRSKLPELIQLAKKGLEAGGERWPAA